MTATHPDLTTAQRRIFRFVVDHFGTHQRPPSIREVMAEFGINSPNGVVCHLKALAKKGYVELDKKARGIRVPRLAGAVRAATEELLAELDAE